MRRLWRVGKWTFDARNDYGDAHVISDAPIGLVSSRRKINENVNDLAL